MQKEQFQLLFKNQLFRFCHGMVLHRCISIAASTLFLTSTLNFSCAIRSLWLLKLFSQLKSTRFAELVGNIALHD